MGSDLLTVIWVYLIGFGVMLYVILDGYSLGIGILFPFVTEQQQRGIMVTTVEPFWDGNQTWLVLSAAGLYGAFPLVYATLFPAMYIPVIVMLMALFFRGMTFEFRFEVSTQRWFDSGFFVTTTLVTFIQGMIVGSVIDGLQNENGYYTTSFFGWFSPFGLITGAALVIGYALLGAAWLIVKTDGALQARFLRLIRPLLLIFLAALVIVAIGTPLVNAHVAERWFSLPSGLYLAAVGVTMLALVMGAIHSARHQHEKRLFAQVVGLFAVGCAGLALSLYPLLISPDITIWKAASQRSSQLFLLVGYAIMIPIILSFTAYSYRAFAGKVRESED